MGDEKRMAGRPNEGRNVPTEGIPGERPVDEEEKHVGPPASADRNDESASRAAVGGSMPSGDPERVKPTPGIPKPVDAASPSDATDADPPGGSAANQRGRAPDR